LSYLPAHPFEFFDKIRDLLEHTVLFGKILRIERAHSGQDGIEFSAIIAGKFAFERGFEITSADLRPG